MAGIMLNNQRNGVGEHKSQLNNQRNDVGEHKSQLLMKAVKTARCKIESDTCHNNK